MSTSTGTSAVVDPSPPRTRPRGMGTWRGLALSMLTIVAVVGVFLALTPRPAQILQPGLDATGKAAQVAKEAKLPVELPKLGSEWKATSVGFADDVSPATFTVGYHRDPDQMVFLGVREAALGTDATVAKRWITDNVSGGIAAGRQTIDGVSWERYASGGDPSRNSLVRLGAAAGAVTVILTGTQSFDELAAIAVTLAVVRAR